MSFKKCRLSGSSGSNWYLKQSFKLCVFMDWQLCWDVTLVLSMHHQGLGSCTKKDEKGISLKARSMV